jgi:signal transduction histidine kinase
MTAASIDLAEQPRPSSLRLAVPLAAGAVATAVTVWAIGRSPVLASPTATGVARGLFIASFVGAGVYLGRLQAGSRLGALLVADGLVYAVTSLNGSADPVWFTLGMTVWAGWLLLLASTFLSFPRGRLAPGFERWFVGALALAIAVIWASIILLSQDLPGGGPFVRCISTCPHNGLQAVEAPDVVGRALVAAFDVVITAGVAVVGVLIVAKVRSPSRLRRRAIVPLSIAFLTVFCLFCLSLFLTPRFPGTADALRALTLVAILAVPLAIVVGQRRAGAHAERSGALLVARIGGDRVGPARIQALLRDSLGDPTLALALRAAGEAGYLDVDGGPIELAGELQGRTVTYVMKGREPVAAIVHDPALEERQEVLDGLGATSLMLLENTRLVDELTASRARIVAAGEQERLRLERDLHDGAQQRLMAIQIKLSLARDLVGDRELAERLDEIGADAATAIAELRALAHGIYPTVLRERGIADGLASFARTAPVPVRIDDGGVGRFPAEVEGAIYFCATEAIQNAGKHAGAGEVTVRLGRKDDALTFAVIDDGRGFDPALAPTGVGLVSMRDRIGAVGGELEIESSPGHGTTVRGTIPIDGDSRSAG